MDDTEAVLAQVVLCAVRAVGLVSRRQRAAHKQAGSLGTGHTTIGFVGQRSHARQEFFASSTDVLASRITK